MVRFSGFIGHIKKDSIRLPDPLRLGSSTDATQNWPVGAEVLGA